MTLGSQEGLPVGGSPSGEPWKTGKLWTGREERTCDSVCCLANPEQID